ncbi:MAG: hypothetical protein N3E46_04630 [Gemmataceae bacterium]|nr:hypothetical protein [Gemmataceae bacterium]
MRPVPSRLFPGFAIGLALAFQRTAFRFRVPTPLQPPLISLFARLPSGLAPPSPIGYTSGKTRTAVMALLPQPAPHQHTANPNPSHLPGETRWPASTTR